MNFIHSHEKNVLCLLAVLITGPITGQGVKFTFTDGKARCLFVNLCNRTYYGTLDCYSDTATGEDLRASFLISDIAKMEKVGDGVECPKIEESKHDEARRVAFNEAMRHTHIDGTDYDCSQPNQPCQRLDSLDPDKPVYDCGKGYVRARPGDRCQQVTPP